MTEQAKVLTVDGVGAVEVPRLTPGAQRILEVASELFYRDGVHAVGVDTIAAESGVTKRTLYNRFGSKEHLVAIYLRARHDEWWARLEARIDEAAWPKTLAVIDAYRDDPLPSGRGCAFLNAAGELLEGHPGRQVIVAHKQCVQTRLRELVDEDLKGERRGDLESLAGHLFLLIEGAVAHRGIDGNDHWLIAAKEWARELLTTPRGDGAA